MNVNRRTWHLPILLLGCTILTACSGTPAGVEPVRDYDLSKYLGTWYEVARLDHRFERGMEQVTATYSLLEDGSVRVLNRGFIAEKGMWKDAEGKARLAGDADTGHLEVSFFGPFYSSYVVFELDEVYQYAFVSGPSHSYLWFLSRTPQVSPELKAHFQQRTAELGFDLDELIWVAQTETP